MADTILQHVSEAVSSVAAVTSLGEGCSDIADRSLSQKIVQSLQKNNWLANNGKFCERTAQSRARLLCSQQDQHGRSKNALIHKPKLEIDFESDQLI